MCIMIETDIPMMLGSSQREFLTGLKVRLQFFTDSLSVNPVDTLPPQTLSNSFPLLFTLQQPSPSSAVAPSASALSFPLFLSVLLKSLLLIPFPPDSPWPNHSAPSPSTLLLTKSISTSVFSKSLMEEGLMPSWKSLGIHQP